MIYANPNQTKTVGKSNKFVIKSKSEMLKLNIVCLNKTFQRFFQTWEPAIVFENSIYTKAVDNDILQIRIINGDFKTVWLPNDQSKPPPGQALIQL